MKKLFCILVVLLLTDCKSGHNDSSESGLLAARLLRVAAIANKLPHKLTTNVPLSIKKGPTNLSLSQQFENRIAFAAATTGPDSPGYTAVSEAISEMSQVVDLASFELIIIEKAIDIAKSEPGACIPGNRIQIEITDAMISELKSAIIRTGLSETNAQLQLDILQEKGEIPKSGQIIPSPAIQYKSLSTGEYSNEINYSFASNMAATHQCPSGKNPKYKKHLRFTDDFKKVTFGYVDSITFFSTTIVYEGTITLMSSASSKAMMAYTNTYNINGTKTTDTFFLENCDVVNKDDCNIVKVITDVKNSQDATQDKSYEVHGRVDDKGGYLETTFRYDSPVVTKKTKELFDISGSLKGYQEDTGSGYTTPYSSYPMTSNSYNTGNFSLDEISIGMGNSTGISDFDSFAIVADGEDPNNDPSAIIGEGFKDPTKFDLEYWGSDTQISTAKVWLIDYDPTGSPVYTLNSPNTIVKL
jgi:hypothetical protein